MEDHEKRSLAAFRKVAREVRGSSIVSNGLTIKHGLRQTENHVEVAIVLLPPEALKSLCVSVRKVYMKGEPGYFYRVNKIVGRYDRGAYLERATAVRNTYELVLRGDDLEFRLQGSRVLHQELFEAWLNRYTFHDDAIERPADRAGAYEFLQSMAAPVVDAVVHKVALQLAGCVLEMDDLLADWLGEERLPRIIITTPDTHE